MLTFNLYKSILLHFPGNSLTKLHLQEQLSQEMPLDVLAFTTGMLEQVIFAVLVTEW